MRRRVATLDHAFQKRLKRFPLFPLRSPLYAACMQSVRVGVIGMGNMGRYHADYLAQGKVPRCTLAAIATSAPEKAPGHKNAKGFATGEELTDSGAVDAVLICTPHYSHTTLGIRALERGLHVMVEK